MRLDWFLAQNKRVHTGEWQPICPKLVALIERDWNWHLQIRLAQTRRRLSPWDGVPCRLDLLRLFVRWAKPRFYKKNLDVGRYSKLMLFFLNIVYSFTFGKRIICLNLYKTSTRCLKFFDDSLSWTAANALCQEHGAHLLTYPEDEDDGKIWK